MNQLSNVSRGGSTAPMIKSSYVAVTRPPGGTTRNSLASHAPSTNRSTSDISPRMRSNFQPRSVASWRARCSKLSVGLDFHLDECHPAIMICVLAQLLVEIAGVVFAVLGDQLLESSNPCRSCAAPTPVATPRVRFVPASRSSGKPSTRTMTNRGDCSLHDVGRNLTFEESYRRDWS